MRRALTIGLVTLMLSTCKLRSLATSLVSFEGEIEMTSSMSAPAAMSLTTLFEMKGDKLRTEAKGLGGFVTLTDVAAKKTYILDTTGHTYTEVDLAAVTAAAATAPTKSPAKVINTGRTDKVAGYSCDVYEIRDAGMRTEACTASGLSMLAFGLSSPFSAFSNGNDAWSEVLGHGFPLRITVLDAAGAPMMKMEATRIERRTVPDADLSVPPGYTKTPSLFGTPPTTTAKPTRGAGTL
jgi:hypothetical protein